MKSDSLSLPVWEQQREASMMNLSRFLRYTLISVIIMLLAIPVWGQTGSSRTGSSQPDILQHIRQTPA
jgi:hypothetical protein